MANYGEELVYWYLRFNGFFPLVNFVVHKSVSCEHTSDADIIAVRPPHVYEEIGGRQDDWDPKLQDLLDFRHTIGLICEVKTGRLNKNDLFPAANVYSSVDRMGLFPDNSEPKRILCSEPIYVSQHQHQIAKLLIAHRQPTRCDFLFLSVSHIRGFLKQRLKKYVGRKYSDRMFFHSSMLQEMVADINSESHLTSLTSGHS